MIGAEGAANRVADWLTTALPERLGVLRARLAIDESLLPNPNLVAGVEHGQLALEEWPAVLVQARELVSMTRADVYDDATELYRCVYQLRCLSWVRAETIESTDLLRKRYTLGLRETLMWRKSLVAEAPYGSDPTAATESATVVANSLRESYSELFTDTTVGDVLAGSWVDVQVAIMEVLDVVSPVLGTAQQFDVTPTNGPVVHPGL